MKRTAILFAAAAICSTAAAQSKIEQLLKDIPSWKSVNVVEKNNYEDDSSFPTTYCRMEKMVADKKAFGDSHMFTKAFNEEAKNAYTFYRKTEDSPNASGISVAYGTKNEYSVTFGTKADHNYLVALFRDGTEPTKRTAYAIVWYEQGNNIEIITYRIYGDDPKRVKKSKRTIFVGNTYYDTDDDGNTILSLPGQDSNAEEIKSDIDFMRRFGTLRTSLIYAPGQDKSMLRVGIVVKIVDLCKKHASLLSDNERQTCIKALRSLPDNTSIAIDISNDPYITGMLEEACLALKK